METWGRKCFKKAAVVNGHETKLRDPIKGEK